MELILKKIEDKLGRLIKIDVDTKDFGKGNFACLYAEVDLIKKLGSLLPAQMSGVQGGV